MRAEQTLVLVLFFSALVGAQQASTENARDLPAPVLLAADSFKLLPMPTFHAAGFVQCDASGNLYFATGMNNDSAVTKVKPDGSYSIYVHPPEDAKETYFIGFRASSDGLLRILVAGRDKLRLYEFGSDESNPRRTDLDIPHGLDTDNFLVLPNSQIAIRGTFNDKAAPQNQGKQFLGQFDVSGRLVRDLREDAPKDAVELAKQWSPNYAAYIARSGNSYMLAGEEILIVRADGVLQNRLHLTSPEDGYRAVNVQGEGSRLLITFFKKPKTAGRLLVLYEMINSEDGQLIRIYKPSEELGNNLVCFSNGSFTFLAAENRHLKLITAKP